MRVSWSLLLVASVLIAGLQASGVENGLAAFNEQLSKLPTTDKPCAPVDVWLGKCGRLTKRRVLPLTKPDEHSGPFFASLMSRGPEGLVAEEALGSGRVGIWAGPRSLVIAESLLEEVKRGSTDVDVSSLDLTAAEGSGITAMLSDDGQNVTITSAGNPPVRMVLLKHGQHDQYEAIFVSPDGSRTVVPVGEKYVLLVLPIESIAKMKKMEGKVSFRSAGNFEQVTDKVADAWWAPSGAWLAVQISDAGAGEPTQVQPKAKKTPLAAKAKTPTRKAQRSPANQQESSQSEEAEDSSSEPQRGSDGDGYQMDGEDSNSSSCEASDDPSSEVESDKQEESSEGSDEEFCPEPHQGSGSAQGPAQDPSPTDQALALPVSGPLQDPSPNNVLTSADQVPTMPPSADQVPTVPTSGPPQDPIQSQTPAPSQGLPQGLVWNPHPWFSKPQLATGTSVAKPSSPYSTPRVKLTNMFFNFAYSAFAKGLSINRLGEFSCSFNTAGTFLSNRTTRQNYFTKGSLSTMEAFKRNFGLNAPSSAAIGIFWDDPKSTIRVIESGDHELVTMIFKVGEGNRLEHVFSSSHEASGSIKKIRVTPAAPDQQVAEHFIFIVTRQVSEHIANINYVAPKTEEEWELFGATLLRDFRLKKVKVPVLIGRLARDPLRPPVEPIEVSSSEVVPAGLQAPLVSQPPATAGRSSSTPGQQPPITAPPPPARPPVTTPSTRALQLPQHVVSVLRTAMTGDARFLRAIIAAVRAETPQERSVCAGISTRLRHGQSNIGQITPDEVRVIFNMLLRLPPQTQQTLATQLAAQPVAPASTGQSRPAQNTPQNSGFVRSSGIAQPQASASNVRPYGTAAQPLAAPLPLTPVQNTRSNALPAQIPPPPHALLEVQRNQLPNDATDRNTAPATTKGQPQGPAESLPLSQDSACPSLGWNAFDQLSAILPPSPREKELTATQAPLDGKDESSSGDEEEEEEEEDDDDDDEESITSDDGKPTAEQHTATEPAADGPSQKPRVIIDLVQSPSLKGDKVTMSGPRPPKKHSDSTTLEPPTSPFEVIDLTSPESPSGPSALQHGALDPAIQAESYKKMAASEIRKSTDEVDNPAMGPAQAYRADSDESSCSSEDDEPPTLYPSRKDDPALVTRTYEKAGTRGWFKKEHRSFLAFLPSAKTPIEHASHFETLLYRGRKVKAEEQSCALARFGKSGGTLITSETIVISGSLRKSESAVIERMMKMLDDPLPFPQYPEEDLLRKLGMQHDTFGLMVDRSSGDLVVESTEKCPLVLLGFRLNGKKKVQMRPRLLKPGDRQRIKRAEQDEIYAVTPYQALVGVSERLGEIRKLGEEGSIKKIARILEESAKGYKVSKEHRETGSTAQSPTSIVFKIKYPDGQQ